MRQAHILATKKHAGILDAFSAGAEKCCVPAADRHYHDGSIQLHTLIAAVTKTEASPLRPLCAATLS